MYQVDKEEFLNKVVIGLVTYSIYYNCALDQAINEYDQDLCFLSNDFNCIFEAGEYILSTITMQDRLYFYWDTKPLSMKG